MSSYRLVDTETGMIIRHYIRTLREADREREWYEKATGSRIRIIKVFAGDNRGGAAAGGRGETGGDTAGLCCSTLKPGPAL
ncbi:MAG TPA: hypothetical protein PLN56_04315 [Methanoregulaceae archaeon]|nr:MAG: hypothetical protein IPI71_02815 [Methanolinea sp.]HON81009.1 hypothetical protein [Methanoregulaceae archaeon]HPD10207.1 hypothetical protein [Methanoregulaceae archaeon]HRT14595.1 hypothetical protein [Methanoregulaceae archaeon]HRU30166.1 hypothetical protein [Methanoregulaceae archaeon]